MGLGAAGLAVVVRISRQPQARQGRLETGTSGRRSFFIVVLVLAWKGPVAFYKTTSPNLPGFGLAHREPEGRRRCWWREGGGGLQTA